MRRIIPVLFLLAFLSFIPSVFSQNSDEGLKNLKKSYPILMKTYGDKLQKLQVEYIVAIDLSESMNKAIPSGTTTYFQEVKRGIIQFLNAIPDSSKISIIGFGATVRWVQIPTVINNFSRGRIGSVVNDLKADEGYTDLKGAVNFLIEGCSSASTIKYLFAFTDFNNDPPASSPFAKVSWEDLQKKYTLISKNSLIDAFALKLPIETSSGRDLPSVRMVFPGLNVIEFDAASLQNWFSDRCGKMMEQNLWTFTYKDMQKIQLESRFNLIAQIGLSGQINVTGQFQSLPEYIQGLSFTGVDKMNISGENGFVFSPSEITRDKSDCRIGDISFKDKAYPFSFTNHFSGILTGKFISPASDEINRLYAVVSLKQLTADKTNRQADSYMLYSQNINSDKGFIITWPLWLFFFVLCCLLIFLGFLIKNTILPHKLKGLALLVESHTALTTSTKQKVPEKQSITIGPELIKPDIVVKDMSFNAKIQGKRGCPFNVIIKKSIYFWYSRETVGSVELNGNPVFEQSFKIKLNDKITVRQGASFFHTFSLKSDNKS